MIFEDLGVRPFEDSIEALFRSNSLFSDLWKCPQGVFQHAEFKVAAPNKQFLQPECKN